MILYPLKTVAEKVKRAKSLYDRSAGSRYLSYNEDGFKFKNYLMHVTRMEHTYQIYQQAYFMRVYMHKIVFLWGQ